MQILKQDSNLECCRTIIPDDIKIYILFLCCQVCDFWGKIFKTNNFFSVAIIIVVIPTTKLISISCPAWCFKKCVVCWQSVCLIINECRWQVIRQCTFFFIECECDCVADWFPNRIQQNFIIWCNTSCNIVCIILFNVFNKVESGLCDCGRCRNICHKICLPVS